MKLQFNKTYIVLAYTLFLIELAIAFIIKTGFIRHTLGDYLVVILLYAIIRGCTNIKVCISALAVLLIAYSIELLQDSFTAKLIFGSTFHFSDLLAYTLGIITVLLIEASITKFQHTQNIRLWKH